MNKFMTLGLILVVILVLAGSYEVINNNNNGEALDTNIEMSKDMQNFLAGFNGSYIAVEEAFANYEVANMDRDFLDAYDLANPQVVAVENTGESMCYDVDAEAGITIRRFTICWQDSQIVSASDLGIQLD